jgi:uncharacterized protein
MNSRSQPFNALALLGACATLLCAAATNAAGPAAAPAPGDWRATVHQFAATHLKHPAWGLSHSQRDYDLARSLAAEDHVLLDDDVLYAAAYLHDVAAFKPYEKTNVDHADEGARLAEGLLRGTGFPMTKIEAVRGAIRTHMFERDPVGSEAIYLHDADALDWLGAIGVARIFGLVDPNGGEPDGAAAVKMLQENLAAVPPRVISKAGRAALPERVHELKQFLKELGAESQQFRTL